MMVENVKSMLKSSSGEDESATRSTSSTSALNEHLSRLIIGDYSDDWFFSQIN